MEYTSSYRGLKSGYLSIREMISSGISDERNVNHASNLLLIPLLCNILMNMSSGIKMYRCSKSISIPVSDFCLKLCIYVSGKSLKAAGLDSNSTMV